MFQDSAQAQKWQRRWLEMAAESADAYLRSPSFLQALKCQIDSLIQCRQQANRLAGAMPQIASTEHEALLQRLNALQEQVFSQQSGLEQQLAQLAAQSRENTDRQMKPPESFMTGVEALLQVQQTGLQQALTFWQELVGEPTTQPPSRNSYAGVTPHDVVYQEGTLRLLRYRGESGSSCRQPVLICFSLINRPYILDLQPRRSVVQRLLRQGLDVYLIDWGAPTRADRTKGLSDYIGNLLDNAVSAASEHAGADRVNLLGYCMGGTMAAIYAALRPERIRNLILLAAPIDFSGREGLLNVWSDEKYFDVDGLIDAFGNCPAAVLQYCFQLMKPVQNLHEKYLRLFEKFSDEDFMADFLAMERWTGDNIPMAGETFREFVKKLYRRNLLIQGELELGGRVIDLREITHPLLLLVANYDHLAPPSSTLALAEHVSSRDIEELSSDVGHVGLAVSRRAHRDLWPAAARWMADHSSARIQRASYQNSQQPKPHTNRSPSFMSDQNTLDALRRSSFFQDVADEHLQALAEISQTVEYPAQKTIFAEFETAHDVYVIVSGDVSVAICQPKVGCRQLAQVSGGELLGWSPMLERRRLSATAVTMTPVKAIVIDGQKLVELCKSRPELGYEFMQRTAQVLAERLYATRIQLLEMSGVHLPEVALESD